MNITEMPRRARFVERHTVAKLAIAICLLVGTGAHAQDSNYVATIERIERSYQQYGDLSTAYQLAVYSERHGDRDRSKKWLATLAENAWKMGLDTSLLSDSEWDEEYSELIDKLQQEVGGVSGSSESFSWQDPELIPESIAYDPETRTAFAGSLYKQKVVQRNQDAMTGEIQESDFFTGAGMEAGLGAVYGIKFDARNDWLWILHNSRNDDGNRLVGRMTVVDRSGRMVKDYSVAGDGDSRELNDLCFANDRVYVTDSANGAVLWGETGGESLDILELGVDLWYPNGIACDDTGDDVFIADAKGIVRLENGNPDSATRLEVPRGYSIGGVDGLYLHSDLLIGVQNSIGTPKVLLIQLGDDGEVQSIRFRDAFSPFYGVPTTGFLVNGCLYYIANSSIDLLQDNGRLAGDGSALSPANVLGTGILSQEQCGDLFE